MNITYKKLIRDNVPEIIKKDGGVPHIKYLNDKEYSDELIKKLHEEANEFNESHDLEELADVVEVICAISELYGFSFEDINSSRIKKKDKNGGFKNKIFLVSVER